MGEALPGSLCDSQAAELRRNAGLSEDEQVAASRWWPWRAASRLVVDGIPGIG